MIVKLPFGVSPKVTYTLSRSWAEDRVRNQIDSITYLLYTVQCIETIQTILVAITEIFVKNVISSQDIKKYKLTQR